MDGEVLLGPVPGWKAVIRTDPNGDQRQKFVDPSGEEKVSDPRFGDLPEKWVVILAPDRLWPEKEVWVAQNTITGQIIYSDPRYFRTRLRARGIALRQFALV
jgi:hypothetical protein